jgi:hypothetical protein
MSDECQRFGEELVQSALSGFDTSL